MRESTDCPDCGVNPGQRHEDGCDVARCSGCGGQRLQCTLGGEEDGEVWGPGHVWDSESEDFRPNTWTGVWPGVEECQEYGYWVKAWDHANPGWFKTTADDPNRSEDLNTLIEKGVRGELRWTGERWVK